MKYFWFPAFRKMLLSASGLFLFVYFATAQLCQGSLGDAVVNRTFGSGANPGQPLAAGITNYSYVSNTCPNDGQYTIANATSGCFNNSWFTVSQDHTPGDVNGYMMIVNASNEPGEFYVDTVRGLCGNTTYEFASWILNVHNAGASTCNPISLPNVTFRIETTTGTVLQTFQTGNIQAISGSAWNQYGFNFATPANTTAVVLRMINNAPGGCGNDLIIDDITFRPCGAKVTATISGGGTLKNFCAGDTASVQLSGTISASYTNPFYQWQLSSNSGGSWTDIPGANSPVYNRTATLTGNYLYRLTVADGSNISITSCRVNSDNITVNVNALPAPQASNNGPGCEGQSLVLSATNGETYEWTGPGNYTSNTAQPTILTISTANAGKYYVKVTTQAGCINTDSTIVSVYVSPVADAGADLRICEGASTLLQGSGGASFAWAPDTGLSANNISSPTANPTDSTLYILTVSNGTCTDTDSVLVAVLKKPVANAGPDLQIFQGGTANLQGSFSGSGVVYYWTPDYNISGSDSDINISVAPLSDTTYTLHVASQDGCGTATDEVFVRVFKKITVPNVFSPNGDGINDDWRIDGLFTFPESDLHVFDRYGRQVYASRGYPKPWDGKYQSKELPVGTYYYIIDLKNGLKKLSGSVTVLK
ncbi:MAG: gliding motility-associated C-terminal domain-containing protein [Chitinophagaceae bacterium]